MYSRYICVALVALVVANCATDIPPAMENEVDLEATWTEAHAEILVQQKSGKDDSACQKVADDAIMEVGMSCESAQKLVKDLPRGPHCCKKGVSLVTKAQKNVDDGIKGHIRCKKELEKLANVRVTFSNVRYRDLRDGQCHRSFFTGSSYRNAKAAISRKEKELSQWKGRIKAFEKALEDAKKQRYNVRESCRSRTRTNMNNMVRKAKGLCNTAKNRKTWTRAHHMMCVLKKSTLAGCRVRPLPRIHAAKLDLTKCLSYKAGHEFTVRTGCNDALHRQLQYLDRQNLQCGKADSALTRFHFHGCGGRNFRYTGRCHKSTNGYARTWTKYTPCNHAQHTDLQYLDRHRVDCGKGNVLTGFYFARNHCGGRNMRYRYQCATPRAQMGATVTKYTPCNTAGGHRLQYLDRHAPDCGHGKPMQGFYFQNCGGGKHRYQYTCASPGKGLKA